MARRVIVCGGRDFNDKNLCFETLDRVLNGADDAEIISGHAKGADLFGEEYALQHSIPVKVFKPDWERYGRGAGPMRNHQMLEYALKENAVIIAFWDGKSSGTRNMIQSGEKAGVEMYIIRY